MKLLRWSTFAVGVVSVGLATQQPAFAQSQACEGFFQSYSKSEIVDVLVNVRESWMSLAGAQAKVEMLGKADDMYITPATVCRDLALAHTDPSVLADGLKKQRSDREAQARWYVEYQKQGPAQPAEVSQESQGPVEMQTVAAGEGENNSTLPAYDIKAHCRKIGDVAGGSYQIEETCRKNEQEAQKALTTITIPSRISKHCQEIGIVAGGSYQIMLTCVKQEIEAKNRL